MKNKTSVRGFLEELSTEQLLDLLWAEYESPEDADEDLVLRIMEVIEERDELMEGLPTTEQGWEDFQKYFNTPDGEDCSPEPTEELPRPVHRRSRPVKRLLTAALIAVMLMLLGMAVAQAFGADVFGVIARWTDETFHFAAVTGSELKLELESENEAVSPENEAIRLAIQSAIDECGFSSIPIPSWYPEGSELAREIKFFENTVNKGFRCSLSNDDNNYVVITLQRYYGVVVDLSRVFEKDSFDVEECSKDGWKFYVLSNLNSTSAAWTDGQTILKLSGNISLETMKQIINSVGD